jgi:hypothetical protein
MTTKLSLSADVVCSDLADLIRIDPREPFAQDPEFECWYCGSETRSPFRLGKRVFCCKACAGDYAE